MQPQAVAVLVAVMLAACAPQDELTAPPETASSPTTVQPSATQLARPPVAEPTGPTRTAEVPAALDWSADLVAGGQLYGGDLAGRHVVLWFWAPW